MCNICHWTSVDHKSITEGYQKLKDNSFQKDDAYMFYYFRCDIVYIVSWLSTILG